MPPKKAPLKASSSGRTAIAAAKSATPKKAATKTSAAKTPSTKAPATKAGASKAKAPKAAAKGRVTRQRDDEGKKTALAVAGAALDKKALNVEIIDVHGKVDYADYVVVMSGRSDRQVAAIARGVEDELKANHKTRCLSVEGLSAGTWVLMDFGDVVVHIFHEDTRGYYDLESLWIDAARVNVPGAEAAYAS